MAKLDCAVPKTERVMDFVGQLGCRRCRLVVGILQIICRSAASRMPWTLPTPTLRDEGVPVEFGERVGRGREGGSERSQINNNVEEKTGGAGSVVERGLVHGSGAHNLVMLIC